jgi:hypothetical protein
MCVSRPSRSRLPSRWQDYHAVWPLLVFGWICNYVVRMAFSPLLEPVIAEFALRHAQGDVLFSVFF